MFRKKSFWLILVGMMGVIPIGSARADFICPSTPNVHMLVRTDVSFFGQGSAEFVNSQLSTILGTTPNIVDAGAGTPTIAGVQAACDANGCSPTGAHYAMGFPGSGGFLGANLVGDAYTSNIPFNFSAEEHVDWLFNGGGLALEQSLYDAKAGGNFVQVIPVMMTAPEHGLWWHDEDLPMQGSHRALPNKVDEADAVFAGQKMRFFGNGGRLMVDVFGVSNAVTPGLTPYVLMKIEEVLGVDFLTPDGDLDVFIERPGLNILNAASLADPAGPISNFGYKTFYAKGWHQDYDVYELLVNREYYDHCLTADQRQALNDVSKAYILESRDTDIGRQCQAIKDIRSYLKSVGGSFHNSTWPKKILAELKSNAFGFFSAQATAGSDFKKVFDSMNAFKPYVPHDIGYPDSCDIAGE